MRRLAILTSLALAAIPLTASAYPGDRPGPQRVDRQDRGRWTTLSKMTPARQGRDTVRLSGRDQNINRIRLEAARGAPRIQRVIVHYANRASQDMPVNAQLSPGQDQVLQLDGRRVERITVVTDARSGGAYTLSGA